MKPSETKALNPARVKLVETIANQAKDLDTALEMLTLAFLSQEETDALLTSGYNRNFTQLRRDVVAYYSSTKRDNFGSDHICAEPILEKDITHECPELREWWKNAQQLIPQFSSRVMIDSQMSGYEYVIAIVGAYSRITHEEERLFARLYKAAKTARVELGLLDRNNSANRRSELIQQVELGQQARTAMIYANLRLVLSHARKSPRGIETEDLFQEGVDGLMIAVDRYDPSRGYNLSTYATWWIRQKITRYIEDHLSTIRLPVHMRERLRRISRSAEEYKSEFGEEPSIEELSELTGLSRESISKAFEAAKTSNTSSLNQLVGESDELEFGELIADESSQDPVDELPILFDQDWQQFLWVLSPREEHILKLRYGLEPCEPHTLEEVGQIYNLSRERIRQIVVNSIGVLRENAQKNWGLSSINQLK